MKTKSKDAKFRAECDPKYCMHSFTNPIEGIQPILYGLAKVNIQNLIEKDFTEVFRLISPLPFFFLAGFSKF